MQSEEGKKIEESLALINGERPPHVSTILNDLASRVSETRQLAVSKGWRRGRRR